MPPPLISIVRERLFGELDMGTIHSDLLSEELWLTRHLMRGANRPASSIHGLLHLPRYRDWTTFAGEDVVDLFQAEV